MQQFFKNKTTLLLNSLILITGTYLAYLYFQSPYDTTLLKTYQEVNRSLDLSNEYNRQINWNFYNAIDRQREGYPQIGLIYSEDKTRQAEESVTKIINQLDSIATFLQKAELLKVPKVADIFLKEQTNVIEAIDWATIHLAACIPADKGRDSLQIAIKANWTLTPELKNGQFQQLISQIPTIALIAFIRQLQQEVLYTELATLEHILNDIKEDPIEWYGVIPYVRPESNVIKKGETYKAEVHTISYLRQNAEYMRFFVDGEEIPSDNGIAKYEISENTLGIKNRNLTITVRNPISGKTEKYRKTIEYDVVKPLNY